MTQRINRETSTGIRMIQNNPEGFAEFWVSPEAQSDEQRLLASVARDNPRMVNPDNGELFVMSLPSNIVKAIVEAYSGE